MGAGRSGLFYGTHGSKSVPPITERKNLRYSQKKTCEYLLNPNHPKGGSKAKFFVEVLGYSVLNPKHFHEAVCQSIVGRLPVKTEMTPYGIRHTYHTTIKGLNGKLHSANVVVAVQKDNGRITYKIVTVYPMTK